MPVAYWPKWSSRSPSCRLIAPTRKKGFAGFGKRTKPRKGRARYGSRSCPPSQRRRAADRGRLGATEAWAPRRSGRTRQSQDDATAEKKTPETGKFDGHTA